MVAKRYVVCYQQTTMFTSFKESVNYHNFCLEALRYNKKQMETGVSIITEIFPLDLRSWATYYE